MLCHCWQCYHCLFNVKLLIPHSLFLRNILAFSFSLSVFPPFLLFIDLLQGVSTVVYHSTRCQMRQLSWSYAAGKNMTGHSWKTFSGGFKRRLILFFKNIIFQKFLFSLYSYSVLLIINYTFAWENGYQSKLLNFIVRKIRSAVCVSDNNYSVGATI